MYHPKDIIDAIAGNVRATRSPFGIPKFLMNTWWKGQPLRREGDALLFTGLMYQFVPYITTATGYLERFEDSPLAGMTRFARYQPKRLAGMGLAMLTSGKEKKQTNAMLRTIADLLTRSQVDFYYTSDLDDYSGILLYDLGDQEGFISHARYVAEKLTRAGVRKIITVDPHTTYALKVLYPKLTGARFEVTAYFERLNLRSDLASEQVTLHDPCFYGRYLQVSDTPRRVLKHLNVQCLDVRNSGEFTSCCGGPAESVSPALSREVMRKRVGELQEKGVPIVAMCPICLGNLRKGGAPVEDLSSLLARRLVPRSA